MSKAFTHETYISPFTWRYGSDEMRAIWSEYHKRLLLRRVWIALAKAQRNAHLVTDEQVADLVAHEHDIDIEQASQIEERIHHDLMAEITTYAQQCPLGGKIIHLGATSMDVLDNMDIIRQREALSLLIEKTETLLETVADRMESTTDTPCMAFTHIQPAEITTIGYRLALTAQDLLDDLTDLRRIRNTLRAKGFKGAVGTSASYAALLEGTGIEPAAMERMAMEELGLEAFEATSQVYPRKQDLRLGFSLSALCATLAKFAFDLRFLQSPAIGEVSEPFGSEQVGSSAMPFKRNPVNAEKIDSLCRFVAAQVEVLWHNAADMLLERTLDDSANRRIVIAELFLATEEAVRTASVLVEGMQFHESAIKQNLQRYGLFAASERLFMELGRRGADRQQMHEVIRRHCMTAWDAVQKGEENPLATLLTSDKLISSYIPSEEMCSFLTASKYVGDAPQRARIVLARIKDALEHKDESATKKEVVENHPGNP